MRYVGFYSELFYGDAVDGALRDVERALPDPDQEAVLKYLHMAAWIVHSHFLGEVPVAKDQAGPFASAVVTDGLWVWPGNLADNVKRYHVKLPDGFMEAMRANNWTVPRLRDICELLREDKRRRSGDGY